MSSQAREARSSPHELQSFDMTVIGHNGCGYLDLDERGVALHGVRIKRKLVNCVIERAPLKTAGIKLAQIQRERF